MTDENLLAWRSAHVITAIVVGAVGLIVFALWGNSTMSQRE